MVKLKGVMERGFRRLGRGSARMKLRLSGQGEAEGIRGKLKGPGRS